MGHAALGGPRRPSRPIRSRLSLNREAPPAMAARPRPYPYRLPTNAARTAPCARSTTCSTGFRRGTSCVGLRSKREGDRGPMEPAPTTEQTTARHAKRAKADRPLSTSQAIGTAATGSSKRPFPMRVSEPAGATLRCPQRVSVRPRHRPRGNGPCSLSSCGRAGSEPPAGCPSPCR